VAYLEDPLPTTRLVVAGGGGGLPAKFANAFKRVATIVTTDVSSREAHGWFSQRLAHAPVKLAPAAAALVEEHLGEDLDRLTALLATLEAAYGHGVRIDEEHLRPYLGEPGSVPPWDLTEAIDNGETETALTVLHRLMAAGDRHPLVVLAVLHRHFGNVLRLQSPTITSEAEAAQALGVPKGRSTFPARKALDAARRLGPRGTGDAIMALADAELALKGKVDLPPELVLEVLVARLCRLSRTRASGAGTPAASGGQRRR
jgi:DNA polymerase-3 subunit delta